MGCDGIANLVFFKVVAHLFGNGEVIAQAKRETGERGFFRGYALNTKNLR